MATEMGGEESIFDQALRKQTPEERSAFLDQTCGLDSELRREIEALLLAHERAGGFLESPPAALKPTSESVETDKRHAAATEKAGSVVGPYKLLEQIGEGGMGTVFMAEQLRPVQRRVALKLIKPGLDTRQVIARFEAERQALALMDHPCIAKVFDAGATDAGRSYFVMELVRGIPITEYCDQHQLTPRQRLELFVPVCQAVQHAHQKGIIHRDLKPSNVLVTLNDDKPVPKIIDFGIAKATAGNRLTERTLFTHFRELIGTPLYMSPEQAEMSAVLDVDTRSDVYSLGVMLYELLTGATPFDKDRLANAAYDEVRRIIREEEPPRPSTRLSSLGETLATVSAQRRMEPKKLGQLMRGELDWVVMRALEKDRGRRYQTALGLAHDVERFLNHEPIEASPPSRLYRLRKFVRRNRVTVTSAAAIALVLLAATAASTWQAARATRAEHRANRERDQATTERRRADEQAEIAKAINTFLDEDVLAQASAYGQASSSAAARPDPDLKVRDALDRAKNRIGERFKGQPLVEAAVRQAIGEAYLHMGRYEAAEPQLENAVRISRSAAGPLHAQTLRSLSGLALLYFEQGRYADAEPRWREVIEGSQKTQGEESSETISAMANLGLVYLKQGRFDESERILLRAFELGRKSLGEEDQNVISARSTLADLYLAKQEYPKAEAAYGPLIEVSRRVCGEKHPDTVILMTNLGIALLQQEKYAQAEAMGKRVYEIDVETLGPRHPDTLRNLQFQALAYSYQGRYDLAEPLLLQALEGERKVLGERHISTLNSMHDLAVIYWKQGKHAQADELFKQAYDGKRAALGDDHPSTLTTLTGMAVMNHERKRYDVAEPLYRQALAGSIRRWGERHPETAGIRRRLANLYFEQDRFADAEPLYAQLSTLSDAELGLDLDRHAGLIARYGLCLFRLGKVSQAEAPLADAYRRLAASRFAVDPLTGDVTAALAQLCESTGRADEAAKWRAEVAAWQARAATQPASAAAIRPTSQPTATTSSAASQPLP